MSATRHEPRAAKTKAALGFKPRTGKSTVIAVSGKADAPVILVKALAQVAFTFEEGAIFHVAQEKPFATAGGFLRDAEHAFVTRAREELARIIGSDMEIVGAVLAAPLPKKLPPLESILKSHPLVHAAEGELYRRVFAEACSALGAQPQRVPAEELASRVGKAVGLSPTKVAAHLAAMGKASGKPWAAEQKEAALAAWLALATA
jgi:hypothetical protein